jgi:hypothetical protein
MNRILSTTELRSSERAFLAAMQRLGFGRFEYLRIKNSELVLDPWPATVRGVKFCAKASLPDTAIAEFLLKQQVVELFEYIRSVEVGEIRILEVRNGLPFSMEIDDRQQGARA